MVVVVVVVVDFSGPHPSGPHPRTAPTRTTHPLPDNPRTTTMSQLQRGSSESPNCSARQESAPTASAKLARPLSQNSWFRPGFLWRSGKGNSWSPQTICLPPPQPRPPTTLRSGPTSSGHVLSLRRRASAKTAPSMLAAWVRGEPSQCNGDTSIVSTASCAPPQSGKPSAKISNRRWSRGSGGEDV